jgi:hypothetical protein
MAAAVFGLCGSSGSIVVFSSPSNRAIEGRLVVYVAAWAALIVGGGSVGCLLTDPHGRRGMGWFLLLGCPLVALVPCAMLRMRRKIGELGVERLKEYIADTVFFQCIMVSGGRALRAGDTADTGASELGGHRVIFAGTSATSPAAGGVQGGLPPTTSCYTS